MSAKDVDLQVANEVARESVEEKKKYRDKLRTMKVVVICLTILLSISLICGTVIAMHAIDKQTLLCNISIIKLST